jgi:hypothetical protein
MRRLHVAPLLLLACVAFGCAPASALPTEPTATHTAAATPVTTAPIQAATPTPSAAPTAGEQAFARCQSIALRRISTPATAKAPPFAADFVDPDRDGSIWIRAYLDAQNAGGAMVRAPYRCHVRLRASDGFWEELAFAFE